MRRPFVSAWRCCVFLTIVDMTCRITTCHAWSPSRRIPTTCYRTREHKDEVVMRACESLDNRSFLQRRYKYFRRSASSRRDENTSSSKPKAEAFGKQEFWESFYRDQQDDFSWYSSWDDIAPFISEWIKPPSARSMNGSSFNILLPGIGSDVSLVQSLWKVGFRNLYAFDYAQESTDYCQKRIANDSAFSDNSGSTIVDFRTADARDLSCYNELGPCETHDDQSFYFDAVIDKGTLDSIYLAGSTQEEKRYNLDTAVSAMQRLLRPGTGIFWSLSGICTDELLSSSLQHRWNGWQKCADTSLELYETEEGYFSNSLDGTLLVWRKPA